jgi:hypothetical protein
MNRREAKRDEQRVRSNREELLERMARALPEDGAREALDGLFLARLTTVDLPVIFRVEEASDERPYFGMRLDLDPALVASMSPLQFQKQIRLQEARRLMLGEELDAASAGHRVGYEDPAYFSRDYKKLFGAPPQRDIARLRGSLEPGGAPARV